jgi:PAS domain-containing protein
MNPLALLLPVGPVVVLGFFYLRRIAEGHGAARWAWAWAALWTAGVLGGLGSTAALAVGNVAGALFMAFMLAGVIEFRGAQVPRWLLPACAGFGVLRATLTLAGRPDLSYLIAAPYELLLGAAALTQVGQAPAEFAAQPSHRLLGPALFALAVLDVVDVILRFLGHSADYVLVLWVTGGFAVALIQIVAVVDRLRLREFRGREERERLAGAVEGERRTLRAVLDAAPVGVFLVDPEWRITMANRLGAKQFGLGPPEGWVGRGGFRAWGGYRDRVADPHVFDATLASWRPRSACSRSSRARCSRRTGNALAASSHPETSPRSAGSRPSCASRRRWRPSARWQAGSPTTSTTSSRRSSATRASPSTPPETPRPPRRSAISLGRRSTAPT